MTTDDRLRRTAAAVYLLGWALFGLEVVLIQTAGATIYAWFASFLAGMIASFFYWHRYRGLGWVLFASAASLLAVAWGTAADGWGYWNSCLAGLSLGVMLESTERFTRPTTGLRLTIASIAAVFLLGAVPFLFGEWTVPPGFHDPYRIAAAAVSFLMGLLALYHFFRPWFELMIEPPLWWMFRIRGAGPGLVDFPVRGPCLVIANHACWFDPIILAKLLPRPLTPMMTGRFYDLPVISRLMRRFGIIKVIEQSMRRELPELKQAIAALDRGECLVVFPEGYLRRHEEKLLKRFGRGVWQILKERPDTPIYSCWIDGNWGSYTSYFNGPPTRNKKRDRARPIGVGMNEAEVLDADVLANHLHTRIHLMNRVIEARTHLGLPALPAFDLPTRDEDAEAE